MSRDKIEVNHLTHRYGDLLVLDDISFNIKDGEFVCVVGPTGCGKTTFLNLLTKLIAPTSGEILIDGGAADPKKHNISVRLSGAVRVSLAQRGGQHSIRHED